MCLVEDLIVCEQVNVSLRVMNFCSVGGVESKFQVVSCVCIVYGHYAYNCVRQLLEH